MKKSGSRLFLSILTGIVLFICLLILVIWAVFPERKRIEDLENIARNQAFQCLAKNWVDENIPTGNISDLEGKISTVSGMVPSFDRIHIDFPWEDVGMSEHSGVSALLGENGLVKAVIFQEGSRIGIYVKPKKNMEIKLDASVYRVVSERVGVFYTSGL